MRGETYEEFIEKFKPKKTTDDCYTPPEIYEVIKSWACRRYGINPDKVVRPFWPGADYTAAEYPDGCVVIDNPPFSILSKICSFYLEREIPFFLFCPSLTAFSGKPIIKRTSHIICDCEIIYENGAKVRTSFITSFEPEITAQTSPELTGLVNAVSNKIKKTRTLPKYEYPDYIVTAAMMQRYARYGVDFRVERCACMHVSALDAQRKYKKAIFGGGLLLSEKAAAEKAAAEKAAAEKAAAKKAAAKKAAAKSYALSERELDLVKSMGGGENDEIPKETCGRRSFSADG